MRKILVSFILGIILAFSSVGVSATTLDTTPVYDTQQLASGVITLSYNNVTDKKVKVVVEKSGQKIYYNLNNDGISESFPLQFGNGDYKVTVYENIAGEQYKYVSSKDLSLTLSNNNLCYLNSIQNINWNENMSVIKKAKELTQGLKTENEKITAIYKYVVNNVSYDYKKMSTISTTYVPDIGSTYESYKGICYDFSSMFASMLRSVGIPAKLVKGYADTVNGYHAWNEIYNSTTGKWIVVDTTYDSRMRVAKANYSMVKDSSTYSKVYEY